MFDLHIGRTRFRPTLPWPPTESNLRRARARMVLIKAQIVAGTFSFAAEFPDYRRRRRLEGAPQTLTCSDILDAFLRHSEARMARGDLAPSTLSSYRQILNYTWRPRLGTLPFLGVRHSTLAAIADAQRGSKKTYNNLVSAIRRAFEFGYRDHPEQRDPAALLKSVRIRRADRRSAEPFAIEEAEMLLTALYRDWGEAQGNYDAFRFFTGLRPSEQIALRVSDYADGFLQITKSRVRRLERDSTKTGVSREVELCPRALDILKRQLQLREQLQRAGRIDHDYLFFDEIGRPFQDTRLPYARWGRTLRRLPIRYRKPYAARHSSVSWNLMIDRNPLWVARQHGHTPAMMLGAYAAWTQGTRESDVDRIRSAMRLCEPAGASPPFAAHRQHRRERMRSRCTVQQLNPQHGR